MLLFPHVQRKAHEELDRVIGRDRLPEFSDQDQLPYIKAICLELLRWRPAAPLGVPHKSIADDEYRGMLIPKGSIIIGNGWLVSLEKLLHYLTPCVRSMLRNERNYGPNPDEFDPE
jgi:cytochrome P450